MFGLLLLSTVLGAIVGYEREVHERPAGLRTHMLVCMGAALITILSKTGPDPTRIAAQIVTGIGFLGAGTILRQGNMVRGLTTAASLWTVSAIGMAVGFGGIYAWLAVFATGVVFLTLSALPGVERRLGKRVSYYLTLNTARDASNTVSGIIATLINMGVVVESVSGSCVASDGCKYRLEIALAEGTSQDQVVALLSAAEGLESFEWA